MPKKDYLKIQNNKCCEIIKEGEPGSQDNKLYIKAPTQSNLREGLHNFVKDKPFKGTSLKHAKLEINKTCGDIEDVWPIDISTIFFFFVHRCVGNSEGVFLQVFTPNESSSYFQVMLTNISSDTMCDAGLKKHDTEIILSVKDMIIALTGLNWGFQKTISGMHALMEQNRVVAKLRVSSDKYASDMLKLALCQKQIRVAQYFKKHFQEPTDEQQQTLDSFAVLNTSHSTITNFFKLIDEYDVLETQIYSAKSSLQISSSILSSEKTGLKCFWDFLVAWHEKRIAQKSEAATNLLNPITSIETEQILTKNTEINPEILVLADDEHESPAKKVFNETELAASKFALSVVFQHEKEMMKQALVSFLQDMNDQIKPLISDVGLLKVMANFYRLKEDQMPHNMPISERQAKKGSTSAALVAQDLYKKLQNQDKKLKMEVAIPKLLLKCPEFKDLYNSKAYRERGDERIEHIKRISVIIAWAVQLDNNVTKSCYPCFSLGTITCDNFNLFAGAKSINELSSAMNWEYYENFKRRHGEHSKGIAKVLASDTLNRVILVLTGSNYEYFAALMAAIKRFLEPQLDEKLIRNLDQCWTNQSNVNLEKKKGMLNALAYVSQGVVLSRKLEYKCVSLKSWELSPEIIAETKLIQPKKVKDKEEVRLLAMPTQEVVNQVVQKKRDAKAARKM